MKMFKWPRGLGYEAEMAQTEAARFKRLKELRQDVREGRMTRDAANKEWAKIAVRERQITPQAL